MEAGIQVRKERRKGELRRKAITYTKSKQRQHPQLQKCLPFKDRVLPPQQILQFNITLEQFLTHTPLTY